MLGREGEPLQRGKGWNPGIDRVEQEDAGEVLPVHVGRLPSRLVTLARRRSIENRDVPGIGGRGRRVGSEPGPQRGWTADGCPAFRQLAFDDPTEVAVELQLASALGKVPNTGESRA